MMEGFIEVTPITRPGVYALLWEGVVVYIGQASRAMMSRIEAHRSLAKRVTKNPAPGWLPIKAIRFDQVYVLPCRLEDLDAIERGMIDLYRPRYNIKLKPPTHIPSTTPLTITHNGRMIPIARPTPRFERRL